MVLIFWLIGIMKNKILLLALILFITNNGFNQTTTTTNPEAQIFNTRGYEFMMNGNHSEAIHEFDSAILLNPSDANYYHNRAFCYNAIDSANCAIVDYLKAIKLNPGNYEYYYLVGNIFQKNNEIETAESYYTKALNKITSTKNPDTYLILFNRGNCYIKEENYEPALADYDSSLKLNPNHFASYANRGISKIKQLDTLGACYDWYIAKENQIMEAEDYYTLFCTGYDFSDSIIPLFSSNMFSEFESDKIVRYENNIHSLVEQMPKFPGGDKARINYLNQNIFYPYKARKAGIQGRVFVLFNVEEDGSLTNIEVIRGIGGGCDEEAVKAIENMPKWEPGIQFGEPVRVQFTMPILFRLNNGVIIKTDEDFINGLINMKFGDYDAAIKHFSKSIKNIGVEYKEAYANRGICYYNLGKYIHKQ